MENMHVKVLNQGMTDLISLMGKWWISLNLELNKNNFA
jgi:hypothetical protein